MNAQTMLQIVGKTLQADLHVIQRNNTLHSLCLVLHKLQLFDLIGADGCMELLGQTEHVLWKHLKDYGS